MSVMKMKFINIVAPINEFDNFVRKYIIDENLQLENALSVVGNIKGLYPFLDENPYDGLMKKANSIIDHQYKKNTFIDKKNEYDLEEIEQYFDDINFKIDNYKSKKESIKKTIDNNKQIIMNLKHMENVEVELDKLFHLSFVKFRFGKLPKDSFKKLQTYLKNLEVFVTPVSYEKDSVWIIYFLPECLSEKIDSIFASLYFERIYIPEKAFETPGECIGIIEQENERLINRLMELDEDFLTMMNKESSKIINYYSYIKTLYDVYNIRKYSGHTSKSFYIAGWIPEMDLEKLIKNIDKEEDVSYVIEDPNMVKRSNPPTELKNVSFFKPFESIVKIYGLPSYDEIDPTVFIAITYIFLFGMMFGDIGQGAVLSLIGAYVYFKKKNDIGGVLIPVGISSVFFGFLYGSIFGYEHVIKPFWMNPLHGGKITYIMGISVGIGVILITIAMIYNLINGIIMKDIGKILFDKNGIAGFVFYWGFILFALYYFIKGKMIVSVTIAVIILIIPLLCISLREPLEKLMQGSKDILPEEKGSFFAEAFFEAFETVLGFVSNTISFVRVSAFALNHVGLFMAIFILANMLNSVGNVVVVIIGNIIIIGLEGLIVGIQDLRLAYYELFSRFFIGEGRPFKPVKEI